MFTPALTLLSLIVRSSAPASPTPTPSPRKKSNIRVIERSCIQQKNYVLRSKVPSLFSIADVLTAPNSFHAWNRTGQNMVKNMTFWPQNL